MRSRTTSSSAPSPGAELELGLYTPEQSAEASALERACPQGHAYQLSFRRDTFHRRAENFARYRIVTARHAGRLVGIAAVALKEVCLASRRTQAAFYFDARVHPAWGDRGVAKAISRELATWARPQVEFEYCYALHDNGAVARVGARLGARPLGSYAYLVYPVCGRPQVNADVRELAPLDLHAQMRQHEGYFDLYSDPFSEGRARAVIASWMWESGRSRAGCSAWSNRGILGEVIEHMPWPMRLARAALRAEPLRRAHWPRVPADGEELRSWYLFDFFATDGDAARKLMQHVARAAMERGIDWCHVIHAPNASWIGPLRAQVPRAFAPIVRYVLLGQATGIQRLERLYVDIRDV